MLSSPTRYEIDHRTIKFIIGLIALSLANITSFLTERHITSISASYHYGGPARDFFVGFLFAIAAFFAAYNGQSRAEMILSRLAALAALGVALFPCGCDGHEERVPHVHYISAGVLFVILVGFCWIFYRRARGKGHTEALRRAGIYLVTGLVIVGAILVLVANALMHDAWSEKLPRLVYYGEKTGLVAFSVSWLTASKILPWLSSPDERLHPLA